MKTKVKPDGVIAGDNWGADPEHALHGVYIAVDEFVTEEGYEFLHKADDGPSQFAIRRA